MIHITIEDRDGRVQTLEIPEDINLSLMELLRAADYEILATCGGMALCATCLVAVQAGQDKLQAPSEEELDMLDTLPNADEQSRLACQIRLNEQLDGLHVKIEGALE